LILSHSTAAVSSRAHLEYQISLSAVNLEIERPLARKQRFSLRRQPFGEVRETSSIPMTSNGFQARCTASVQSLKWPITLLGEEPK
jgi:hypothetical protein